MQTIELPLTQPTTMIRADHVQVRLPSRPVRYYRHGWQSWSLAAWTDPTPLPIQKPTIFHTLHIDVEYAREANPHGSWMGAVELHDGSVLLLGALGLDAHVQLNGEQFTGRSEAGEIDWFIASGQEKDVFAEYARELEVRLGRTKTKAAPRVWCSWYSLFYMIDEVILFKVFEELGDLPFDVLQVDDGWQISIGDWEPNAAFPSGMTALAEKIKSTGCRAGLWLAPLIAVGSSRLFREHSDWFLRAEDGRFVSAGFNWGEPLYALDTTHPAATEWLVTLMKQVRRWGFDYLKLDFLYAGALKGRRHKDMQREAALREAIRVMREAMGNDAFFLTCGVPILPALGLCDAIRMGPDVSSEWESDRDANLFSNPSTPGTKNAIRTVIHRLWLNQLVQVDPDVAYFTTRENSLSGEEKALLQDLALVCNFRATSDLPQWLTADEREQLRAFLNANPKVTRQSRYVFEIDGRQVDFSPAASLPAAPKGWTAAKGILMSWLGNQPFVLKIDKQMGDRRLRKRKENL